MKKLLNTLLCLMLSLALVLSFAACSKDKDDKKEDEETSKSDTVKDEKEDEEPAEDEKPADEEDEELVEDEDDAEAKVKAYVAKSADLVEQAYTNESMSMKVIAEGTKIVYVCTLKTVEKADLDTSKIEELLDGVEGTLETLLESMKREEPSVSGIAYRYLDKNGDVIAEAEI